MKNGRATEALISALKGNENPDVRTHVVSVLGGTGDERYLDILISTLKNDRDPNVRGHAADALATSVEHGRHGVQADPAEEPRIIESLISALSDEDSNVQGWAAWSLSRTKAPKAQQALAEATAGKDLKTVAENYSSLIRKKGNEMLLVMALLKYGNKDMAQRFVNSGNVLLDTVASKWALDSGYHFFSVTVPREPTKYLAISIWIRWSTTLLR